jgi:hypothetical protein
VAVRRDAPERDAPVPDDDANDPKDGDRS